MSQDVNLGHVVGQGVPSGGTAGQILKKNGSTNFDTSWATLDGSMVPVSAGDSTTVQQSLAAVKSDMGIVEDGNTATHTIAAGQYVIWKGALYTASAAIPAGTTLSTSNLTAVSGGGLNALNGNKMNSTIGTTIQSVDLLAQEPGAYLTLNGNLADIGAAWDAITVYDKLLVGTFSGSGLWMYMGYKYSGSKYGMMWAQRFGDWEINILSVNNGNKHIGKTALQSN